MNPKPLTYPQKQYKNAPYFYHSDHASTLLSTGLGSSSFITDLSGSAVQHLQYMPLRQALGKPYGETFVNQTSTSWDARYKFTGKEKNGETGYSYFGARYYDSDISIWLSVDPMTGKYPSMSPFMYVGGHPTMITDPNGMDWIQDEDGNYKHDKNITKDSKLAEGETYIGKSKNISVTDGDGNELYQIGLNEDGSMTDKIGIKHEKGFGEYDAGFKSGHKIISNTQEESLDYTQMLKLAIPVAVSVEGSFSGECGWAASGTPYGGIFIFRGRDANTYTGFTAANVGVGWFGASVTISQTTYLYFGNLDNFSSNSFSGSSYQLQISAGELIIGGTHYNFVRDRFGGVLFGVGPDIGFGGGSFISGQATWQTTKLYK